jgi:hypothetical protein
MSCAAGVITSFAQQNLLVTDPFPAETFTG